MEKPIIEVKGLSKRYDIAHMRGGYVALRDVLATVMRRPFSFLKHKAKRAVGLEKKEVFWALKGVDFTVARGEVVGVIGANGAGKSTLLKVLSQITPPTEGEVVLRGRVGSLLEVGTGFHPELTGRENIFLNGAILGMKRTEIAKKFDEIVAFAGVDKFLDTPVKHYSSGMYVRLAFSVAAHMDPDILLVDEVLSVGDAEFQKKCLGKMDEITKKEGRTIIFVSHNMAAIENLCATSMVFEKGKLIFKGDTREAISNYLSSNKANEPVVEIKPAQHIRGTGEAKIKRAAIGNKESGRKNRFSINEPIAIEITYAAAETPKKLSLWTLFIDQDGTTVMSSFQKDVGAFLDQSPGEHTVSVRFDKIGLLPGRYSVSAGIFAHDAQRIGFADWVDACQTFEIVKSFADGRPFDNRSGIVSQDAVWETI